MTDVEKLYCNRCSRPIIGHKQYGGTLDHSDAPIVGSVYATHESYGCDTGCCGHMVHVMDKEGKEIDSAFYFSHPDKDGQLYELNAAADSFHVPIDKEKNELVYD